MSVNGGFRPEHHLLAALLSLVLLGAKAQEPAAVPPTFGEQMREMVEAHDRGEITYEELMVRRDNLSKQLAGGSKGNLQAKKKFWKLPKFLKRPAAEKPTSSAEVDQPSLQPTKKKFLKLPKFIKKSVTEAPKSSAETDHLSPPSSAPPEVPASVQPAAATPPKPAATTPPKPVASTPPKPVAATPQKPVAATPPKPALNCSGIRKFMLRCLRRPYPAETEE